MSGELDTRSYTVVVNHEDQYSLWPSSREIPAGWQQAGMSGAREQCLAYIRQHWTDMRPRSLRERMGKAA
ncbi:MAG: MbtH family NRPS accessory protein [Reyranella sp.]|nr:MbtH family NRPS accessory protein [Reyranella sp.]